MSFWNHELNGSSESFQNRGVSLRPSFGLPCLPITPFLLGSKLGAWHSAYIRAETGQLAIMEDQTGPCTVPAWNTHQRDSKLYADRPPFSIQLLWIKIVINRPYLNFLKRNPPLKGGGRTKNPFCGMRPFWVKSIQRGSGIYLIKVPEASQV